MSKQRYSYTYVISKISNEIRKTLNENLNQQENEVKFFNHEKLEKALYDICENMLTQNKDKNIKLYGDILIDDFVTSKIEELEKNMYEYCTETSQTIPGNFCNIKYDWKNNERMDFDCIVALIRNNRNIKEVEEFRDFAVDWYFKAFGTFSITRNFLELIEIEIDAEEEL